MALSMHGDPDPAFGAMENLPGAGTVTSALHYLVMQKEERPDSRNRQAAGNDREQNEDQIWQRRPRRWAAAGSAVGGAVLAGPQTD
jgi:hypothetical protein